ncbi:uncharacterized protein [Diadema antillarum]|uniref:uncharacterized protein n=1 Tax=Diadema antillarum TaxID=105358 RepID=UPI003A844B67
MGSPVTIAATGHNQKHIDVAVVTRDDPCVTEETRLDDIGADKRPDDVATNAREDNNQSASAYCNLNLWMAGACVIMSLSAICVTLFSPSVLNNYKKGNGCNPESGHGQRVAPNDHVVTPDARGALASNYTDCQVYAHVVGSNEGETRTEYERFPGRVMSLTNDITRHVDFISESGVIRIRVPGLYYVYSQVYPMESGKTLLRSDRIYDEEPMVFSTRRNSATLMRSVIPVGQYATKYHGGIFWLDVGDEIELHVPNGNLVISTAPEDTFFGVFMLCQPSSDGPAK